MARITDIEKKRILIFIVAYQAENHIVSVLERVPVELFNNKRIHFMIIDDASADNSVATASHWLQESKIKNITVLSNTNNQGYGGNQKIGYRLGIENKFDLIILLHGDGQYAPELLPEFIRTWHETGADVILGSRMTKVKQARAGGMPLYKIIGNILLTRFQNFLTGQNLSEYHTGYRAYSADFLRSIPFEINTNDFHFDTEILLQADYSGVKIVEIGIPTHYGDEKCHVDGISYSLHVIFGTLQYFMHKKGMLCSLKYRNLSKTNYQDKKKHFYSSQSLAVEIIKKNRPAKILDIGCGPGYVAGRCQELKAEVTGIDVKEPLPGMMHRFIQADIEYDELSVDVADFDAVLLLDVVEHLAEPEKFLLKLRNNSRSPYIEKKPTIILSTPNIAFAGIRLNLVLGRFNYAERGILDITHKRLFTRSSLKRMLHDCGFQIEKVLPVGPPFQVVMPGFSGQILAMVGQALASLWPTMFAFQFVVVCNPLPGVQQILAQSMEIPGSAGLNSNSLGLDKHRFG